MNLIIDSIGGLCPVQGYGTVDGVPFYFRARGEHWEVGIGQDPVKVAMGWEEGFRREEEWGDGPFAAGYMPVEDAEAIIRRCAEEFHAERTKA